MTLPHRITRRAFTSASLGAAALVVPALRAAAAPPAAGPGSSITALEPCGILINECSLPGETRADGVVPRHANALQVRRDRWLVVYSTHGYRGVDDERSIIYQLRDGAPDGMLLTEGFLTRAVADWRPAGVDLSGLNKNQTLFKQHGHMVAFGVPEGAIIDGHSAASAGVFVAKWRTAGRVLDRARDFLEHRNTHAALKDATQAVEWVQFRLNDSGDDIEILLPVARLRQLGFAQGAAFCSIPKADWMNQSYVPAVPFNRECTEWADCNHFNHTHVAALKYRFNLKSGIYEWVETGPLVGSPDEVLMEASLARSGNGWVIAARRNGKAGVAWSRTPNPFSQASPVVIGAEPLCSAPLTVFRCGDGVLRLFTGDPKQSPYGNARDPLYCWDVDVEINFACTKRRTIFDSVKTGLAIRPAVAPKIDFCELFPLDGNTQLIVYGVSTRAYNHPYENRADIPAVNDAEKGVSAVYYSRVTYRNPIGPPWGFP